MTESTLTEAGLLTTSEFSARRILKAAFDYVRRVQLSGEIKLNPATGMPEGIGGKITFREPGPEETKLGFISVDSLLELASDALTEESKSIWIALDRLDVAFADSPELEANALRALFRIYRDLQGLTNLSLKILLRDDIWKRITDPGFREASHITRAITITWGPHALLNLVIRRALNNEALVHFYDVDKTQVLSRAEEQEKLFYRIFPIQVDAGARKPNTLLWMLSRTADGSRQTAPRELIH